MIAVYVTGHGFGRATRTAEVLREVRRLVPGTTLSIVTRAPGRLFRAALGEDVAVRAWSATCGSRRGTH
jgi:hypothetical protein